MKAVFKVYDSYDLIYEFKENNTDIEGNEYEMVTQTLANDDFYQGLNMTTVIRRKSDGQLFGFQWWDDISKYGEAQIESNGDDHGFEYGVNEDGDYFEYYVFEPVEEWTYKGYRIADEI